MKPPEHMREPISHVSLVFITSVNLPIIKSFSLNFSVTSLHLFCTHGIHRTHMEFLLMSFLHSRAIFLKE